MIPCYVQLFGPRQGDGWNGPFGTQWTFPGPVSSSTKQFLFGRGITPAQIAWWEMIWTPRNTSVRSRLIAFDYAQNGVAHNVTLLAEIASDGSMGPVPRGTDFTNAFNALVAAGVNKYLGFQMIDDGINYPTLYESRLELLF